MNVFGSGMPSVRICLKVSGLFRLLPVLPVAAKLFAGVEMEAGGRKRISAFK